jgi:hypothetical protein
LGADRILAYDHFGNPGVAYSRELELVLMYARFAPGAGWQSVIAEGAGNGGGAHPSVAFDRRELPVIGFASSTLSSARIAAFNGTSWSSQPADPSFDQEGSYSSLAMDSTGKMALAYQDTSFNRLKYVKDSDGDGLFTDETPVYVTTPGNQGGSYASLAFDPLNRPMIAHYDEFPQDLKFSVLDTGLGWVTTTVDSANMTGSHLSMAIDPDSGYPAISYYDDSVDDLRYAAWNGTSWNLTTIDSAGTVGWYTSLAFDPADGNPAISYYDQTNDNLKLAWFNGTSWQTQPVDTVGDVGVTTSLAFNDYGTGFPAIVYGDNLNNLYFIEDPPAAVPEPQTVTLLALGGLLGSALYRRQHSGATHVVRGSPDPAQRGTVVRPATTGHADGETNR